MFAKTLMRRAVDSINFTRREEALECGSLGALDALLKTRVLDLFGIKEEEDKLYVVREMRSHVNAASEAYIKHGRTYLPHFPNSMSPMLSWILLFIYVAMTRGGASFQLIPHILGKVMGNSDAVAPVSRMLLNFTEDDTAWKDAESYFETILLLAGLQYQPIHKYMDGDDVLMVANLVGLHRAYIRHVDNFPDYKKGQDLDEVLQQTFPPMVLALLSGDDKYRLYKSYLYNYESFELVRMNYLSFEIGRIERLELVRAFLMSHGALEITDQDPGTADTLDDMMQFMRMARTAPIPLLKPEALCQEVKKRFGFSLYPEQNTTDEEMRLFNNCSLLSVCLSAPGSAPLMN